MYECITAFQYIIEAKAKPMFWGKQTLISQKSFFIDPEAFFLLSTIYLLHWQENPAKCLTKRTTNDIFFVSQTRALSSVVRALASHARSHWFDPSSAHFSSHPPFHLLPISRNISSPFTKSCKDYRLYGFVGYN